MRLHRASLSGLLLAAVLLIAGAVGAACATTPSATPDAPPPPTPVGPRLALPADATRLALLDDAVRDPAAYGIQPATTPGGMLRLAVGAPPVNLDPHASISDPAWLPVMGPVYEPLVAPRVTPGGDPLGETVICRLCTRWQVNESLTEWTFDLRPGVTWHDGQPLSTQDVVSSFQRAMDRARRFGTVTVRMAAVQSVDAPAAGQVRLVTRSPAPDLLEALSQVMIVPRHILAQDEGALRAYAVGTGPFRVSAWEPDRILLEAWPGYHQAGRPWLDHIELVTGATPDDRHALFLAGAIDVTTASGDAVPAAIDAAGGVGQARTFASADLLHVVFDVSRSPWSDVRARRAAALALDRLGLQAAMESLGTPLFPPLVAAARPWALPAAEMGAVAPGPARADGVRRARELLMEAGHTAPVRGRLLVPTTPATAPVLAGAVQASLKPAGIVLEVEVMEPAPLARQLQSRSFELALRSYGAWRGTEAFTTLLSGGPANYLGIADPVLDNLIRLQQRETDPAVRVRLLQDAQRRLLDQAWLLPTVETTGWTVWQPGVANVQVTQRGPAPVFTAGAAEILWRTP